jgi:hypothetical protein
LCVGLTVAFKEEEREESDDDMGFGLFDDSPVDTSPVAMAVRQAQPTNQNILSAAFGIPGRSNIPSDQGAHKVVITVLDLLAELEWVCVPRVKESVFLRVSSNTFALVGVLLIYLLPNSARSLILASSLYFLEKLVCL